MGMHSRRGVFSRKCRFGPKCFEAHYHDQVTLPDDIINGLTCPCCHEVMCPGAFAGGSCSPPQDIKGKGGIKGAGNGAGKGKGKGKGQGKGGGKGNGKGKGRQAAANAASADINKRKIDEIHACINGSKKGAENFDDSEVAEVPALKKVNFHADRATATANPAQVNTGVKSMTSEQLSKLEAIITRKDAQKKTSGESGNGWRGRGNGRGHGGGRGGGKNGGSGKGGGRHWRRLN